MYGLIRWSLFFLLFFLPIILLILLIYCCMHVSSRASRIEEEINEKKSCKISNMVK